MDAPETADTAGRLTRLPCLVPARSVNAQTVDPERRWRQ